MCVGLLGASPVPFALLSSVVVIRNRCLHCTVGVSVHYVVCLITVALFHEINCELGGGGLQAM